MTKCFPFLLLSVLTVLSCAVSEVSDSNEESSSSDNISSSSVEILSEINSSSSIVSASVIQNENISYPISAFNYFHQEYCLDSGVELGHLDSAMSRRKLLEGISRVNVPQVDYYGIESEISQTIYIFLQDGYGNQVGPAKYQLLRGRQVIIFEPRSINGSNDIYPFLINKLIFTDSLGKALNPEQMQIQCHGFSIPTQSGGRREYAQWGTQLEVSDSKGPFLNDSLWNSYYLPNPYYSVLTLKSALNERQYRILDSNSIPVVDYLGGSSNPKNTYIIYNSNFEFARNIVTDLVNFPAFIDFSPMMIEHSPQMNDPIKQGEKNMIITFFSNVEYAACVEILNSVHAKEIAIMDGINSYSVVLTDEQIFKLLSNPYILNMGEAPIYYPLGA